MGNSEGAIGWLAGLAGGFGPGAFPGRARGFGHSPDLVNILIIPSGVGCD